MLQSSLFIEHKLKHPRDANNFISGLIPPTLRKWAAIVCHTRVDTRNRLNDEVDLTLSPHCCLAYRVKLKKPRMRLPQLNELDCKPTCTSLSLIVSCDLFTPPARLRALRAQSTGVGRAILKFFLRDG